MLLVLALQRELLIKCEMNGRNLKYIMATKTSATPSAFTCSKIRGKCLRRSSVVISVAAISPSSSVCQPLVSHNTSYSACSSRSLFQVITAVSVASVLFRFLAVTSALRLNFFESWRRPTVQRSAKATRRMLLSVLFALLLGLD